MLPQLERRRFEGSLKRKDCVLETLENEVEALSDKVSALTKDLARRRRMSGEDALEMAQNLEEEKNKLEEELKTAQTRLAEALEKAGSLESNNDRLGIECAEAKEKLTLSEAILRQQDGVHPSEGFLEQTQQLWYELGVDLNHREAVRGQIESCLEDTCARKLTEETALKAQTSANIDEVQTKLSSMQNALGHSENEMLHVDPSSMKLVQRLDWLKTEHSRLQPTYDSATERREKVERDAAELTSSMMVPRETLSEELQSLLNSDNQKSKTPSDVEFLQKDLSDHFLSKCEKDVASLRLKKARLLVQNTETKNATHKLVQEMNLSEEEVINLSIHSIKQRLQNMPTWWNQMSVGKVAQCVIDGNGVIPASVSFSSHIDLIRESLASVAMGRRQLSSVLREIIERAQRTLLDTVEMEIDSSEAYASFHDALFRLPPLSKEFVETCITEIEALVSGVESMAQSEIEALTVVWEALDVSMSDRGEFWSEIDESARDLESNTESPFDEVLHTCAKDTEQWVLTAVNNCRSTYKELDTRLFKLESIHKEVEKLKARQDSKSRIISLDSELGILSARLSEFEDKRCNKQRLLSKKSGSAALLKEERFRKQMQAKYSSTLEQLAAHLEKWNKHEGSSFDPNLLSDEVRALLKNSAKGENWVEKRTEFMHLRMTQSAAKRKPERATRLTPPRKRPAKPTKMDEVISRKRELTARAGSPSTTRRAIPRPLQPSSANKKRKAPEKTKNGSANVIKSSKVRKIVGSASSSSEDSDETPKQRLTSKKKRESTTLLPFGKVLSDSRK